MQQRTQELLDALGQADWFAAVGQPLPDPNRPEVIAISSWEEAVECCRSISWENYTLEQQNLLTMHLHQHARERYQRWNEIVIEMKAALEPIVVRQVRPVAEQLGLPEEVVHCVRWDVLGACMESEYADIRPPGFFTSLMDWYTGGRFPCGWGTVDTDGKVRLAEMEQDNLGGPDYLTRSLNFPLLEPPINLPEGRLVVF